MSAPEEPSTHAIPRAVFHLDLGENVGLVMDYACPPGEGIDFLGLQWLVRAFGLATRDRWKCDTRLVPEDFIEPFLTSLEEILTLTRESCRLHPAHQHELERAGALPPTWPSENAVGLLRLTMIAWFHEFYPAAMRNPDQSPRHRAFALAAGVLRKHGLLPARIDVAKITEEAKEHVLQHYSEFSREDPDRQRILTEEAAQFAVQSKPDNPGVWRMPANSGALDLHVPTLAKRLRRLAGEDRSREGKAVEDPLPEVAAQPLDELSVVDDVRQRELLDRLDEIRAVGPAYAAAVDKYLGESYSNAARTHGVTVEAVRWAEQQLVPRLRRITG